MNVVGLKARNGATKTCLSLVLICSLIATWAQPGFAMAPSLPRANAQLLSGLSTNSSSSNSANNRLIVRDNLGLSGLNVTCLLLGCNVLESIRDRVANSLSFKIPASSIRSNS